MPDDILNIAVKLTGDWEKLQKVISGKNTLNANLKLGGDFANLNKLISGKAVNLKINIKLGGDWDKLNNLMKNGANINVRGKGGNSSSSLGNNVSFGYLNQEQNRLENKQAGGIGGRRAITDRQLKAYFDRQLYESQEPERQAIRARQSQLAAQRLRSSSFRSGQQIENANEQFAQAPFWAGDRTRNRIAYKNNILPNQITSSNKQIFSKDRLFNPETIREIGIEGLIGGATGGLRGVSTLAGSVVGGALAGPPGAAVGGALASAGAEVATKSFEALKDTLIHVAEAGLQFQRSVTAIAGVFSSNSIAIGPNGKPLSATDQVSVQRDRAEAFQREQRRNLVPLGIGGQAESAIALPLARLSAQTGSTNEKLYGKLGGALGAAISATAPDLLSNPTRLTRDLNDIGTSKFANTEAGSRLGNQLAGALAKAGSDDDIQKIIKNLEGFTDVVKNSTSASTQLQRLGGQLDQITTEAGDSLDKKLAPGIKDLSDAISGSDLGDNLAKIAEAFGSLGKASASAVAGAISNPISKAAVDTLTATTIGVINLTADTVNLAKGIGDAFGDIYTAITGDDGKGDKDGGIGNFGNVASGTISKLFPELSKKVTTQANNQNILNRLSENFGLDLNGTANSTKTSPSATGYALELAQQKLFDNPINKSLLDPSVIRNFDFNSATNSADQNKRRSGNFNTETFAGQADKAAFDISSATKEISKFQSVIEELSEASQDASTSEGDRYKILQQLDEAEDKLAEAERRRASALQEALNNQKKAVENSENRFDKTDLQGEAQSLATGISGYAGLIKNAEAQNSPEGTAFANQIRQLRQSEQNKLQANPLDQQINNLQFQNTGNQVKQFPDTAAKALADLALSAQKANDALENFAEDTKLRQQGGTAELLAQAKTAKENGASDSEIQSKFGSSFAGIDASAILSNPDALKNFQKDYALNQIGQTSRNLEQDENNQGLQFDALSTSSAVTNNDLDNLPGVLSQQKLELRKQQLGLAQNNKKGSAGQGDFLQGYNKFYGTKNADSFDELKDATTSPSLFSSPHTAGAASLDVGVSGQVPEARKQLASDLYQANLDSRNDFNAPQPTLPSKVYTPSSDRYTNGGESFFSQAQSSLFPDSQSSLFPSTQTPQTPGNQVDPAQAAAAQGGNGSEQLVQAILSLPTAIGAQVGQQMQNIFTGQH